MKRRRNHRKVNGPDAAALRGLRAYAISLIRYAVRLRNRMDRKIAREVA